MKTIMKSRASLTSARAEQGSAGAADPECGERGGVGVVVNRDLQPGGLGDGAAHVEVLPFEVGHVEEPPLRAVPESGEAYADAFDTSAAPLYEPARGGDGARDRALEVVVCLELFPFEQPPGEVARGDGGARRRDVDADGGRARRAEREERRAASPCRLTGADLFDEPLFEQGM